MDTVLERARRLRERFLDQAALIDDLIALCAPEASVEPPPVPEGLTLGKATEIAVLEVLKDHEPAPTREIYEAIRGRVPIGGKNELSTLSARLSLSRRFKRGQGGWRRA